MQTEAQKESYPVGSPSPWDEHCTPQALENWLYAPASLEGATRKWFVDQARFWPKGSRFLDAGCGGGVTLYTLAEAGLLEKYVCVGVDGSEKMLQVAKKRVTEGANFIQADLRVLSLLDWGEVYDKILLRAVLEHHDHPEEVLAGVLPLLADEGKLYIIWWNNPVYSEPLHSMTDWGVPDTAHNAQQIRRAIEQSGCKFAMQTTVREKSARSDEREIWVITRR